MNPAPELADVIDAAIDARLLDVHTAAIGRVEKVHAATRKVDVRLAFKRTLQTDEGEVATETMPVLQQVPIGALRAGSARVEMPIAKGNWVVLVFFGDNVGKWVAGGGVDLETGDIERHGLTGAVAIPLLYPDTEKPSSALASDAIVLAMGSTVMRVSAAGVEITGKLTVSADVVAGAALAANERSLLGHLHPTGMGPSSAPVKAT